MENLKKDLRWMGMMFLSAILTTSLFTACSDDDDPVPLEFPSSSVSSATTATSLTFTWSAVANAASYTCVLSDGKSQTVSGTSVTFSDLTPSTAYTLTITANAATGSKDYLASSPVTLTATTDAPQPLVMSAISVSVDKRTATATWSAVAKAASYDYVLMSGETEVTSGNVTTSSVKLENLELGDYTLSVVAKAGSVEVTDSEAAVSSPFTIVKTAISEMEGSWSTSYGYMDFSHKAMITAYDDGSYKISNWCDIEGLDLEFMPNGEGITITNATVDDDERNYSFMWTGTEYLSIYREEGYTTFTGDATSGQIGFYLYLADNVTYDYVYFTWPYVQTEFTGTVYYNADWWSGDAITGSSTKEATLEKNDDGSYTLKSVYAGVDMTFTINEPASEDDDATITITNALDNSGYKYYYDSEQTCYYVYDGDYSYIEVEDGYIFFYWYDSVNAGYNCFEWIQE